MIRRLPWFAFYRFFFYYFFLFLAFCRGFLFSRIDKIRCPSTVFSRFVSHDLALSFFSFPPVFFVCVFVCVLSPLRKDVQRCDSRLYVPSSVEGARPCHGCGRHRRQKDCQCTQGPGSQVSRGRVHSVPLVRGKGLFLVIVAVLGCGRPSSLVGWWNLGAWRAQVPVESGRRGGRVPRQSLLTNETCRCITS